MHRTTRASGLIPGRGIRVLLTVSLMAVIGISTAFAASSTVIRTGNHPYYGRVLEGPSGYTLYVYCGGASTACRGTHSGSFSPLIARGRVAAAGGSGVKSSKLGTRRLSNGQHQVTYYSQPLYLYKGDHKPGQINGEDNCKHPSGWFIVSTSGRPDPPNCY